MPTASTSNTNGGGSSSTAAPSPTLYVKNIEGKIKKPELRRQLLSLFSVYGRVLDVVATRAPNMRGQAFIVFESPTTSTAAKRGLQNFSFYGKELHIDYARGDKSKALLRRELGEEAVQEMDLEKSKTTVSMRGEKRLFLTRSSDVEEEESEEEAEGRAKRVKREEDGEEAEGAVVRAIGVPVGIEAEVLSTLFSRQDGFVSVEAETETKQEEESWTAAIRFDTQANAEAAKEALNGIQLDPTYKLELVVL